MKKFTFKSCTLWAKIHGIKSLTDNCSVKKAFTQAETAAVLVILGMVAAITIPSLINNHQTAIKRVKIKNALGVYKEALHNMVTENRFNNMEALNTWARNPNGSCDNARSYFKVVEIDNASGCKFKTSDGLWWDIGSDANLKNSRMNKAIVAFKKADLTHSMAVSETTNKAFYLASSFDEKGGLRMMDTIYSFRSGDTVQMLNSLKLYTFINNKPMDKYAVYCNNLAAKGIGRSACFLNYDGGWYILNSEGKLVLNRYNCQNGSAFGCLGSGIGNLWDWNFGEVCDKSGNCYSSCGEDCYKDPVTGKKRYHYALTPNCESQGDYCEGGTVSFWANTSDYPENPLFPTATGNSDADTKAQADAADIFNQLDPEILKTITANGKTGDNMSSWEPQSTGKYYSCNGVKPGDTDILSTCSSEPDTLYQYKLGWNLIKLSKNKDGTTSISIWKIGAFPHTPGDSLVNIATYTGCDNWKNCTNLTTRQEVQCEDKDSYCVESNKTNIPKSAEE